MIAKNKKGRSFGGCVRYVLNERHEILEAEGVLAEDAAGIIRDFAIQRSGRPEIKQPVGHIAVAFSPEDSWKMSNTFMLKLAHEYMMEMGIRDTQYLIVRHHNTDHEHFHIVYNRIDNDLKLISVNNDYKRNIKVCKKLKDKYKLTYGKGKEKVNRRKLKGADKVKYQIHDEIAANLPRCVSYEDLEKRLRQAGISVQYKYRSGAIESPENIQGVSFKKGNYSFKGSEIDRKFSHVNLTKAFDKNMTDLLKSIMEPEIKPVKTKPETTSTIPRQEIPATIQSGNTDDKRAVPEAAPSKAGIPEHNIPAQKQPEQPRYVKRNPTIGGVELTDEQWGKFQSGGYIFLENIEKKDGSGKFSSYVFTNEEKKKAFFSNENPDKMVEYGGITIRLRDKILVENGCVTKAKMKWWGGIDYQYPFVWKDSSSGEVKHSFADPRIPKEQLEKERQAFENRFRRPPATSRTPPAVNRTIPPPRTIPPKRTSPPPKKGPKIRR